MLKELLTPEIKKLLELKDWRTLKEALSEWAGQDIVDLFDSIDEPDKVVLFRILPRDLAAEVFSELNSKEQKSLLHEMSNEHIREIFLELSPDDRTYIFEELPAWATKRLLNLLPPEEKKVAMQLLGYSEESVGRLMTPDFVAVRPSWTVEQSIAHIRKFGKDAETVNIVFVIDEQWHLLDNITLRKLILANPAEKVENLMDRIFHSIPASADQEEAVNIMKKYNLIALPVVDSRNVLLGVITVDDVIDVYEAEVTEDIHKGASVIPVDVNYTTASAFSLFRKRIVWLIMLALAGFLSGSVISSFEEPLGEIIMLAFFIPVLIGAGGNTGTQSATLIIRALVTGDLTPKKWLSVIKKELFVGLFLGITLGAILYVGSYLWKGERMVSLVIGLSVTFIALWANLVGSSLPIILSKLRLDPAVVSSPLISTVMDFSGLLIYFSIAMLILL